MKASQKGEANYDWRAIWQTQSSFKDALVPFDVRQVYTSINICINFFNRDLLVVTWYRL